MYSVRLTRVPENGVLTQETLLLERNELQLGPSFDPPGASVSWELTRTMGKVYGKVHAVSPITLQCSRCLVGFKSEARSTFSAWLIDWMVGFGKKSGGVCSPRTPPPNGTAFTVTGGVKRGSKLNKRRRK